MVRFFAVVRPYPAYGIVVLAVVTMVGLWTTNADPRELDSALGMVLLVQMFVASSGCAVAARRGHYDPVLVHGSNRASALACQWVASIAPGALAWAILAEAGYAWSSPAAWSAMAGTRLAAFLIVSVLAWTIGFALPRGAGASVWMGLLVVLLLRHVPLVPASGVDGSTVAILRAAGAVVLCPFLLLGTHPPIGAPPVWAALCAAAALLLLTIRQGSRLDVFLMERS
jgi:hypothetical protein